jgi:hypothetical protein
MLCADDRAKTRLSAKVAIAHPLRSDPSNKVGVNHNKRYSAINLGVKDDIRRGGKNKKKDGAPSSFWGSVHLL